MPAIFPSTADPAALSRSIRRCFAVLLALCGVAGGIVQPVRAIEHQRVLWIGDPSSEAVISWTTRRPGENHRVHFDSETRDGEPAKYARREDAFHNGKFTMSAADEAWVEPGYYHHVRLDDLEPATAYHLVIASGDEVSREFHFMTAPRDDRPFAMLFGGDSRVGGEEPYEHSDRRKMNRRMAALFEANPRILGLLHGGDYCQTAEWRFLDGWLSDHELTTTKGGRLLPVTPARGNHDMDIGFEEAFPLPPGAKDYRHALRLGPMAAAVVLNTEISLAGDQRRWLGKTLESLRPEHRWLLALYHRPAYPSVRSIQDGAPRRNHWVPLFEKYRVDLVCESHDHALKRTLPIRGNRPNRKKGIIYIGDGGLGVPQREPDPRRWWFADEGFTKPAHHVHMLEFGRDTLRVRAFGMDGDTLDDFRLEARDRPTR